MRNRNDQYNVSINRKVFVANKKKIFNDVKTKTDKFIAEMNDFVAEQDWDIDTAKHIFSLFVRSIDTMMDAVDNENNAVAPNVTLPTKRGKK
jgi:hypothetical protein